MSYCNYRKEINEVKNGSPQSRLHISELSGLSMRSDTQGVPCGSCFDTKVSIALRVFGSSRKPGRKRSAREEERFVPRRVMCETTSDGKRWWVTVQ